RISGAMNDYSLSVNYSEGTATLRGTVASQAQMDTAIQIAQASPQVEKVVNEIRIGSKPATPIAAIPLIPSAAENAARPIAQLSRAAELKIKERPTAPPATKRDAIANRPTSEAAIQTPQDSAGGETIATKTGLATTLAAPAATAKKTVSLISNVVKKITAPAAPKAPPAGITTAPAAPRGATLTRAQIAQKIATVMKESGAMKDYSLSINFSDGIATLRGTVASKSQMRTAMQIAQASPYVNKVVNQMGIKQPATSSAAAPPQAVVALPKILTAPKAPAATIKTVAAPPQSKRLRATSPSISAKQQLARPASRPVPFAASQSTGGGQQPRLTPVSQPAANSGAPAPAYIAGAGGGIAPATFDQPNLPGHAWPSYASYPNYGGLTYPKQYSPTAWPYIGPFYPYPQVPLGWRKVTLEWDDGWWMLDFKD
ncbi:MAG: BON domain-containing protein, partial [Pirellulales bacterium]